MRDGQRLRGRAFAQLHEPEATGARARVVFERRRCAAQHDDPAGQAHSFARDFDGGIARHGVLFVRGLVGFVDDDEPDIRERREDGATRADDDRDLTACRRAPRIEALPFGKTRMQHGDAFAEDVLEAPRGLRGQ